MVCLGNICRSPLAHGIMQAKIEEKRLQWEVDSAGTSSFHSGSAPDPRSIKEASIHNLDITHQRSREIKATDLQYYDLILTMDTSNYNNVRKLITDNSQLDKIKLILNYVNPGQNRSVPDPYYEGGFPKVYEMLEKAIDRITEN
ncbi:MAG: protein-tyrosine phosphatase [Saprospiraceae bacterium]|jgi:protein-tyrosine phosphatase